jgi:hypothetical protein
MAKQKADAMKGDIRALVKKSLGAWFFFVFFFFLIYQHHEASGS